MRARTGSQHERAYKALLPHLVSRNAQLNQEFAFMPTAPPHARGGIFELRTYQLNPGTLLEWESTWYVVAPRRALSGSFLALLG